MVDFNNDDAAIARLIARLDKTEDQLRSAINGRERYALLNLVRAANHTGYSRSLGGKPPTPELADYLQASWLGIGPSFALCGLRGMIGDGLQWAPSNDNAEQWAGNVLNHMGLAANTRRLCGLARHDLTRIRWADTDRIEIQIIADDQESIDRDAITWYSKTLNDANRPLLVTLDRLLGSWVERQLLGRVSTDPLFGIRYTSSEELEEYFEAQAELRAETLPGHDSLENDAVLGPITFGDIRRAIVMGMGRALKHVAFVETLLKRHPGSSFRTVISTHAPDVGLADQWRSRLGLSRFQMRAVMQVLALTPDDLPFLSKSYDAPLALLVSAADGFWHQPIFGALNNPFGWATRKLRRVYSSDWDRAVGSREARFREDLRGQFPEPRFHFCPRPTKLKGPEGVKTDVDAIILDRQSGVLAVFQLKWQEPFEFSLAERESRRRNLAKEGNRWVEVIEAHCKGLGAPAAAKALGVAAEEIGRVKMLRLFVLTRNGARFSGPANQTNRAAWLSWFDLLQSLSNYAGTDPLSHLWERGQTQTIALDRRMSVYRLDGLTIECEGRDGAR